MKRAFGTKTRKGLVDELQYWNDALARCFEKPEIPLEDTDPMVEKIKSLFDQEACQSLRANAQAIHRAICSSWACSCSTPHRSNLELGWHGDNRPWNEPNSTLSVALSFSQSSGTQVGEETWQTLRLVVEKTPSASVTSSTDLVSTMPLSPPTAKKHKGARFSKMFKPFRASSGSQSVSFTGRGSLPLLPRLAAYLVSRQTIARATSSKHCCS